MDEPPPKGAGRSVGYWVVLVLTTLGLIALLLHFV
jgi:hypothetical protein